MKNLRILIAVLVLLETYSPVIPSNPLSEPVQGSDDELNTDNSASNSEEPTEDDHEMISVPPSDDNEDEEEESSFSPILRHEAEPKLIAGIMNDFSFKLMQTINPNSNFIISPLGIFVSLAMTYLGSAGQTRKQLEEALGLDKNAFHGILVHESIKELMTNVLQAKQQFRLLGSNGMFLAKDFTVNPQYKEALEIFYLAVLENLDFNDAASTLGFINSWVAKKTQNMIPKLLQAPPDPLTRLILLNAVYFKGTWQTQFPENQTYSGQFHQSDGSIKMVPLMKIQKETFPYHHDENLKYSFLKLPYDGDRISMIIALPDHAREMPNLPMTDELLCHIRDAMKPRNMADVTVPKFRLEYTRQLDEPLKTLGIRDIFDRKLANLSGIRIQNDLFVSSIMQKAVIEVNEEGSSAAAVTKVSIVQLSLGNTLEFKATHPFVFYIIDEDSGLVLYYGKVYELGGSETEAARGNPVVSQRQPTSRPRQRVSHQRPPPNRKTIIGQNNGRYHRINRTRVRVHSRIIVNGASRINYN